MYTHGIRMSGDPTCGVCRVIPARRNHIIVIVIIICITNVASGSRSNVIRSYTVIVDTIVSLAQWLLILGLFWHTPHYYWN